MRSLHDFDDAALSGLNVTITVENMYLLLKRSQYQTIFKIADYVRRYQLKHQVHNKHAKYKHLRPIFPVCFDDDVLTREVGHPEDLSFPAIMNAADRGGEARELEAEMEDEF